MIDVVEIYLDISVYVVYFCVGDDEWCVILICFDDEWCCVIFVFG